MTKVNILSGYSMAGGSTLHHIALTNLLNEKDIDCTFYGPHPWHTEKCKSGLLNEFKSSKEDILITHFLDMNGPIEEGCKQHILSCHETNLFPLKEKNLTQYDMIQYVSNSQKEWQGIDHPHVVIPPIIDKVEWTAPGRNTAGIVGSLDHHKQVHISIQRALEDGYKRVLVFGPITDSNYFGKHVLPLVDHRVNILGEVMDKEEMYGSVDAVYHSSKRETFNMVKAECKLAGIPYFGLSSADSDGKILEREEIFELWKKCLKFQ